MSVLAPPATSRAPERALAARMRRICRPLLLAATAAAGAVTAQVLFDPFTQHVPLCVFHALTGLQCPGCGMTRAVHALLSGHPLLALRCNLLLVLALPLILALWLRWVRDRWRGVTRAPQLPSRALLLTVLTLAVAYAVLRNLPGLAVLAPPGA